MFYQLLETSSKKEIKVLNLIALNINDFRTEKGYYSIINTIMSESDGLIFFKKMLKNDAFEIKIKYECEKEYNNAVLVEQKCDNCEKRVNEHDFFEVFKPKFTSKLIEFNKKKSEKYFYPESLIVLEDIKVNIHRVIPFVGAGISKSVGLPLWMELFEEAKKFIPDIHHNTFNLYYEKGDVDKMISFIYDTSSVIKNKESLKMKLIEPIVNTKIKDEELLGSTILDIIRLNSDYIITTNYDKLIEKTDALNNNLYSKSKNILTFEGFQMLEDTQFIFHIHGDIDLLGSMIVTNSDYEALYDNEANKRILSGLINKRSMLFLGFSLKDKYFSEEFTSICESNKDYCTNYFVMINGSEAQKDEILKTSNVDFINIQTSSPDDYNIKEQLEFLVDYILGEIVM